MLTIVRNHLTQNALDFIRQDHVRGLTDWPDLLFVSIIFDDFTSRATSLGIDLKAKQRETS